MFLYAETAQSRSATCGKDGSVEHLFALIDLCKLIERHKKFSLGLAESFENDDFGHARMEHREVGYEIRLSYRTRLGGAGSHRSAAAKDHCALGTSRERCSKFFEAVTKCSFGANWATYRPGIGKTGVCNNHVSGYWDGGAIALCDVNQE